MYSFKGIFIILINNIVHYAKVGENPALQVKRMELIKETKSNETTTNSDISNSDTSKENINENESPWQYKRQQVIYGVLQEYTKSNLFRT